jgi:hypothetical protein
MPASAQPWLSHAGELFTGSEVCLSPLDLKYKSSFKQGTLSQLQLFCNHRFYFSGWLLLQRVALFRSAMRWAMQRLDLFPSLRAFTRNALEDAPFSTGQCDRSLSPEHTSFPDPTTSPTIGKRFDTSGMSDSTTTLHNDEIDVSLPKEPQQAPSQPDPNTGHVYEEASPGQSQSASSTLGASSSESHRNCPTISSSGSMHSPERLKSLDYSKSWQNFGVLVAIILSFTGLFYTLKGQSVSIKDHDLNVWSAKKDYQEMCAGYRVGSLL